MKLALVLLLVLGAGPAWAALPDCPPSAPFIWPPTPEQETAMKEHLKKPGRVQPTCKPVEQSSAPVRPGIHPLWLKYGMVDAQGLKPNTAHLPPCPPATPEEQNAPLLPHMTREEIKVWYQLHPPTCDPPWEKEQDKQDQNADLRDSKIPDCPPVATWYEQKPPFECMDKDLKKAQKEIRDGRRVKRHGG